MKLGSVAADSQPASVGAGGLFATLQSAGAGGYGTPVVRFTVQGGMGTLGGTVGAIKTQVRKTRATEGENKNVAETQVEEIKAQPGNLEQQISDERAHLDADEHRGSQAETKTVEAGPSTKTKRILSKL